MARCGHVRRPVRLEALDPEDRLVQWLNEIIVLAVTEGFVVTGAELILEDPGGLRGTIVGVSNALDRIQTELKAATYHDLKLGEEAPGWRAQVVIDV